jgi:hypothetical protein
MIDNMPATNNLNEPSSGVSEMPKGVTANASQMPLLQRAVRDSAFTELGTLSSFVIGFVFVGLTLHYLGNERVGYLMSLQVILGYKRLVCWV